MSKYFKVAKPNSYYYGKIGKLVETGVYQKPNSPRQYSSCFRLDFNLSGKAHSHVPYVWFKDLELEEILNYRPDKKGQKGSHAKSKTLQGDSLFV